MEILGVCILLSAVTAAGSFYAVARMCEHAFDTWIRTTDGWCTREPMK
jgi:hypothetical protein